MIRRFALLQTFVAVARAGKMKQAAQDLALTPGAVSQRIRQLEEVAGRRLFTRTSTGVELSAAGEAMFVALAEPFQAIEAIDMELGSPSSRRVRVSTVPSFAAAWLVPRLATFARVRRNHGLPSEARDPTACRGRSPAHPTRRCTDATSSSCQRRNPTWLSLPPLADCRLVVENRSRRAGLHTTARHLGECRYRESRRRASRNNLLGEVLSSGER